MLDDTFKNILVVSVTFTSIDGENHITKRKPQAISRRVWSYPRRN